VSDHVSSDHMVDRSDTTRSHAAMDCDVNALWPFAIDTTAPIAEVGVAN